MTFILHSQALYIYMPHWPNTRTCSQCVPLDLNARLWHLFTRFRCFLTHAAQCCVWVSPSLQVPGPSSFIRQGIESREIDSFSGWTGWNKRAVLWMALQNPLSSLFFTLTSPALQSNLKMGEELLGEPKRGLLQESSPTHLKVLFGWYQTELNF